MSNSDTEDDWVPNGRPKSTLARSFSAALDDAFGIDNDLEGLSQSVEQKKRNLSSRQSELEELEAKIREAEERLKQSTSRSASPMNKASLPDRSRPTNNDMSSPQRPSGLQRVVSAEEKGDHGTVNGKTVPASHVTRKPQNSRGQGQAANRTFLQEEDDDESSEDEDEEEEEDTDDEVEDQRRKR